MSKASSLIEYAAGMPEATEDSQLVSLGQVNEAIEAALAGIDTALDLKAPLVSPAFTGVPTVPTAAPGTNTTQAASTAYVQTAVLTGTIPARSGGSVAFDIPAVYNTPSAPVSFSALDLTAAVANTEVIGYFNNASQPSFGAGTYVIGTWNPNQLNIVRFVYSDASNIAVSIFSSQGASTNIDTRFTFLRLTSGDAATTSNTTGMTLSDLNFTAAANSVYDVEVRLRIGCSSTGGLNVGLTYPSGAIVNISRIGTATSNSTVSILSSDALVSGTFSSTPYNAVAGNFGYLIMHMLVTTSSTAGTFSIQIKSVTSGQTSTIYSTGSISKIIKIA